MNIIKELEDLVEIVLEGVKYDDKVSNDVYINRLLSDISLKIVNDILSRQKEIFQIKSGSPGIKIGRYEIPKMGDSPWVGKIDVNVEYGNSEDHANHHTHRSGYKKGFVEGDLNVFFPSGFKDGGPGLVRHVKHELRHIIDHTLPMVSKDDYSVIEAPISNKNKKIISNGNGDTSDVEYRNTPTEINARIAGFFGEIINLASNKGISKLSLSDLIGMKYDEEINYAVKYLFHGVVPENRRRIIKRLASVIDEINERLEKTRK